MKASVTEKGTPVGEGFGYLEKENFAVCKVLFSFVNQLFRHIFILNLLNLHLTDLFLIALVAYNIAQQLRLALINQLV